MTSTRNLVRASLAALVLGAAPAHAVVGGAPDTSHRSVVLISPCTSEFCLVCSAVLVSPRHLLTAGVCLSQAILSANVYLRYEDLGGPAAGTAATWTRHPLASDFVAAHDLAVVELVAPLPGVAPARISEVPAVAPGALTLAGWGWTWSDGNDPALRAGATSLDSSTSSPPLLGFGATGATACYVDAGAGLFSGSGSGETLVGIVSNATQDCTGPGIAVDLVGERAFLEAAAPDLFPKKESKDAGGCGTAGTSAPGALVALIVGLVRRRWPSLGLPNLGTSRPPFPSNAPVPPRGYTPDAERLLPPLVGFWPRTNLNDRFGGLDEGGVHAAYDVDGHPVRALVRHASSEAQARSMVEGAPPGQGSAAWARGRTWWFVSGGTVLGDEDPTFAPGDVEAVERFAAALRRAYGEDA